MVEQKLSAGFESSVKKMAFPAPSADAALGQPQDTIKINPLDVPRFYMDTVDFDKSPVKVRYTDGSEQCFEKVFQVDDQKSGFFGIVYKNPADGHAVILFKGMDLPFIDVRMGTDSNAWKDLSSSVAGNWFGTLSEQIKPAQDTFFQVAREEYGISSREVVGYSLGGQLAKDLAIRHGAQGQVFGDVPLPDVGYDPKAVGRVHQNIIAIKLTDEDIPFESTLGTINSNRTLVLDENETWWEEIIDSIPLLDHMPQSFVRESKNFEEIPENAEKLKAVLDPSRDFSPAPKPEEPDYRFKWADPQTLSP